MCELSKEMTKAGIMEELINDTMETTTEGGEDLEEAAQAEVDKILFDLTAGAMGLAPDAVKDTLPSGIPVPRGATSSDQVEEDEDLDDMKARLQALRS